MAYDLTGARVIYTNIYKVSDGPAIFLALTLAKNCRPILTNRLLWESVLNFQQYSAGKVFMALGVSITPNVSYDFLFWVVVTGMSDRSTL